MDERKINERGNLGAMKTHGQQGISEKMSQGMRGGKMFQPRELLMKKKGGSRNIHSFYTLHASAAPDFILFHKIHHPC